jgi:uncharacterized protein
MRIGLISDAHGHLDPKLPALFAGCDLIVDAGDVVKPEVQEALRTVAPVTAVRGNNDRGPAFARVPAVAVVALGELSALIVHDLHARPRPKPPRRPGRPRRDPEIVIHGHSHRPGARLDGGTLYVTPGSAGPRRFSLPRTAAVLAVSGRRVLLAFFDLAGEQVRPYGDPLEADL